MRKFSVSNPVNCQRPLLTMYSLATCLIKSNFHRGLVQFPSSEYVMPIIPMTFHTTPDSERTPRVTSLSLHGVTCRRILQQTHVRFFVPLIVDMQLDAQ